MPLPPELTTTISTFGFLREQRLDRIDRLSRRAQGDDDACQERRAWLHIGGGQLASFYQDTPAVDRVALSIGKVLMRQVASIRASSPSASSLEILTRSLSAIAVAKSKLCLSRARNKTC